MKNQRNESWQSRLREVIYESNTTAGKAFDVALLFLIFSSILVVMLDSVEGYHKRFGNVFFVLE